MREILFRGKRTDNGEWVEGYYYKAKYCRTDDKLCDYITIPYIEQCNLPNSHYIVNPETVGQYTGLKDKNGTKIFEGDIIRYSDSGEYEMYLESLECPEEYDGINFENMWTIDEVVYGTATNYPAFDLNRHDWEVNGLSNLSESGCYFYEVIGNIHDNPELLGGNNNG